MSTSPVWRLLLSQRLMVEQGDPEEVCDLLSRDAAVYCGERLQSEVLRVCVHGHYFRVGPLLTPRALSGRSRRLQARFTATTENAERLFSLGAEDAELADGLRKAPAA